MSVSIINAPARRIGGRKSKSPIELSINVETPELHRFKTGLFFNYGDNMNILIVLVIILFLILSIGFVCGLINFDIKSYLFNLGEKWDQWEAKIFKKEKK